MARKSSYQREREDAKKHQENAKLEAVFLVFPIPKKPKSPFTRQQRKEK